MPILAALVLAVTAQTPTPSPTPTPPTTPTTAPPTAPAASKAPTLKPGSPAPALTVEAFLKGDRVEAPAKGRVCIVEFWATWCIPCARMFPRLSALQKAHPEITVLGVNAWEHSYTPKTIDRVRAFVDRQGDAMAYTVAYDGPAKAADKAWMQAASRENIPACFLVDDAGVIAMIAHPMFLEDVLPRVLAHTWKPEVDGPKVTRAEEALSGALDDLAAKGRHADLIARVDEIEKDFPTVAADLLDVKARALLALGRYPEAYAALARMTDRAIAAKDAPALNQIAWTIVDPAEDLKARDLDLALRAAEKAVEFSASKDAAILDTLARTHFRRGDRQKAIDLQKQAIETAPPARKDELRAALKEYENAGK